MRLILQKCPSYQDVWQMEEALENVEVIIEEWIETAAKLGREIPQSKGRLMYA